MSREVTGSRTLLGALWRWAPASRGAGCAAPWSGLTVPARTPTPSSFAEPADGAHTLPVKGTPNASPPMERKVGHPGQHLS